MNPNRPKRGWDNGGQKYRESPFWDNLEKKKEKKDTGGKSDHKEKT